MVLWYREVCVGGFDNPPHSPRAESHRIVTGSDGTVYLVDDNADVREALSELLASVGYRVKAFAAVSAFFQDRYADAPSCIVSDVRLPGLSGLDFQKELARRDIKVPIIFITGFGDIRMSVDAMKAGALEFLPKPVREQDLLDAVATALQQDRARLEQEANSRRSKERFASLSEREAEVLALVVEGLLNKQIAYQLKLSEVTVKAHRRHLMAKLGARSVADLVRLTLELNAP